MSQSFLVNPVTADLVPYPMEELSRIKKELIAQKQRVFDFGTGDPTIPVWPPILQAVVKAISPHSQYPSIYGSDSLKAAHEHYLQERFGILADPDLKILPTRGSKEAIFHIALSLVGRAKGRKRILYPNPGYPVYQASALFAGGIPTPMLLEEKDSYRMEPWKLPAELVRECAAIWVNYPHNPTGATVDRAYWEELIAWCHRHDVVLLSDDCYVDIYDVRFDKAAKGDDRRPLSPLCLSRDRVIAFMSLSKRSGMTGYRAGFMAGDARILNQHARGRANFGLAMPSFIQEGASVAWRDESHVAERRKIFSERVKVASEALIPLGILKQAPEASFYLWCQVPAAWKGDDVAFCRHLAAKGFLASPSSWLGEEVKGYFRLALVPELAEMQEALMVLKPMLAGTH